MMVSHLNAGRERALTTALLTMSEKETIKEFTTKRKRLRTDEIEAISSWGNMVPHNRYILKQCNKYIIVYPF